MRVAGVGAYVPLFYVPTDAVRAALGSFRAPGIESVAVPDADEDPVTMAWAAGRRALDAAGVDGDALAGIALAATTLPTLDESPVPRLATAFDAPAAVDTRCFTASTAAAGEALATAMDAPATGPWLVVASDAPRGAQDTAEGHAAGAGAAAVVLTADGPGRVEDHATASRSFPGTRFRPATGDGTTRGHGITTYDRAAYEETLRAAVDGLDTGGIDAAAMTMPDGKRPYRAASAAGLETGTVARAETVSTLGDTGAAGPLLGLARAVSDGASSVLLATYGSGSTCHAFSLDVDGVPVSASLEPRVELDYAGAMRRRGAFSTGEPAGGGANVPTPTYRRSLPQRYRLLAGTCLACDDLVFPPENACPHCGSRTGYEDVPLPDVGEVLATTVIGTGGAPPEFVDQQRRSGSYGTAIVRFRVDDRAVDVPLQVVLTESDEPPAIGDRVETRIRVLYEQEGVRRYALKAIPVDVGNR